ncbi:type IV pilin protein [Xanthomonas sp. WHRI 1810A]|uniref:type IV pilin protein n=1 Tax=Xanthomonas sp. WHRI 1810A TaxID=3161565 RepID=UPI0032E8F5C2
MHEKSEGFSLIELMIVVAIIGILAAIAYPSYTEYVKRTHRSEIAGLLSETTQSLERFYSRNGQYADIAAAGSTPAATVAIPAGNAFYTIAADRSNPQAFTLTATPTGTMVGDKCGSFVIDNTGKRSNPSVTGNATTVLCWSR